MPAQPAPNHSTREIRLSPPTAGVDFSVAPFLAIWEVTRSCDLACVHCRASAIPKRDPRELTLAEARALFSRIREMGTRLVVLTGGDPIKREDIFDLIGAAREAGLDPSLSPSVTPLLTDDALKRGREAGLSAVSLSLDGVSPETHDRFRGVAGAFHQTLQTARLVKKHGLELRVNTTITARNLGEMGRIAALVGEMGAKVWAVFFLVPTGRAGFSLQITPAQCESALQGLYRISQAAPYRIKTTEAPQYRRVVLEEMARERGVPVTTVLEGTRSGRGRFMPGLNDGKGFVFISHTGDVYPSGFFPLSAGNVRERSLGAIYRESTLFRALRNPDALTGRCGACAYRDICGGSRARAFAVAGDASAEDPLCAYHPGQSGL